MDFITASFTTSYGRSSDKTHHYQKDTRPWHNIAYYRGGRVGLCCSVALLDGGKCVKCRGLGITNTAKARLVQEDKIVIS